MSLGPKQRVDIRVSLEKTTFAIGEAMIVTVDSDNTACAKPLMDLKVVLIMKVALKSFSFPIVVNEAIEK